MKRAEWAGAVLAESDDIVMVEGDAYFPEAAIRRRHLASPYATSGASGFPAYWHEKCLLS